MADVYRYRRGETNPVVCQVLTIQAVSLGDAVGLSTGNVVRASDEAWSSLSQAQFDFAQRFMGVVMQRKASGTSSAGHGAGAANEIRVATEGVFEFDCATTTGEFDAGSLVAMAKASGNALENQKVELATHASKAIGSVEETKLSGIVKVKVRILSSKMLAALSKAAAVVE